MSLSLERIATDFSCSPGTCSCFGSGGGGCVVAICGKLTVNSGNYARFLPLLRFAGLCFLVMLLLNDFLGVRHVSGI